MNGEQHGNKNAGKTRGTRTNDKMFMATTKMLGQTTPNRTKWLSMEMPLTVRMR